MKRFLCVALTGLAVWFGAQTAQASEPVQAQQVALKQQTDWRYKYHNGQWWYWTTQNQWMYHRNGAWNHYVPGAYVAPRAAAAVIAPRAGVYVAPRAGVYVGPGGVGISPRVNSGVYGRPYNNGYYGRNPYYGRSPYGSAYRGGGRGIYFRF